MVVLRKLPSSIPSPAIERQCREMVVRLGKTENALIRSLRNDRFLAERVERLLSIPAVGPITALTWALEIGEVQRFSWIKKADLPHWTN